MNERKGLRELLKKWEERVAFYSRNRDSDCEPPEALMLADCMEELRNALAADRREGEQAAPGLPQTARECHDASFLDPESTCFGQPFSECPTAYCAANRPAPQVLPQLERVPYTGSYSITHALAPVKDAPACVECGLAPEGCTCGWRDNVKCEDAPRTPRDEK